jgi:hypothetical protein
MWFRIVPNDLPTDNELGATLVYRSIDYSFDVEPVVPGFTSILLGTLSMEVNDVGKIVSAWGLCPHTGWVSTQLSPPHAEFGDVFAMTTSPLLRGSGIALRQCSNPVIEIDRGSGWLRIAEKGVIEQNATIVQFAIKILPGIIMEIDRQNQFLSLWLKPEWR